MNFLLAFLILTQTGDLRESEYGLEIRTVVDYEAGLVYYEEWVDSLYLGIAAVQTIDEYLADVEQGFSFEKFRTHLRQKAAAEGTEGAEGIIPDIKIQMGKERTDVKISGQDKISLGSSFSSYAKDETQTKQGPLSGVKLEQVLDVSVKGVIARKTEVVIDHSSSGNTFTDNNKVRLSYTGDDDEIIKKIEAGDVSLNLPSRQPLPAHQGLFGINTQVKLGPVDIYAVASREQTKAGSREFTGNSQVQHGILEDRDFIQRKYFSIFHEGIPDSVLGKITDEDIEKYLQIYKHDGSNPKETRTVFDSSTAWTYPNDTDRTDNEVERDMTFILQSGQGVDYTLRKYKREDGEWVWVIELKRTLGSNDVLAVACSTAAGITLGRVDRIPNPDTSKADSIVANLLLVWPDNPEPTSVCWKNMWRNHYPLSGQLGVSQIDVWVYYLDEAGKKIYENAEGKKLSEVLGLTDGNTSKHDLDSDNEKRLGELIFKERKPFHHSVIGDTSVDTIYEVKNPDAQDGGKYKIEYEYKSLVSSYTLDPFLVENSVKVWLNGDELDSEQYTVDYNTGTVTLTKTIAPEDKLRITFETKEILALDRKSLLGVRAESELAEGVKLGSSFLYRKVGFSGEGRPMLGLEPFSRSIGEVDLSVNRDMGFLTRWIDRMPFISTETASRFNMNLNSSVSLPNPNTHKSEAVWLEDFEGVREGHSVSLSTPADWYITSLPLDSTGLARKDTSTYTKNLPEWTLHDLPGGYEEVIYGKDKNPSEQISDESNVFKIEWDPDGSDAWAGIIGSTYGRLSLDITEAENLELIIKTGSASGRLHFEFGSDMYEDQLRRNSEGEFVGLDTQETEDLDESNDLNGEEDTGLDRVDGADSLNVSGDDGNDDYQPDKTKDNYRPNGTEGNSRLDAEDLLRNGWSYEDDYYSFTFDLTDVEFFEEYVDSLGAADNRTNWIRISVPIDTSLAEFVKRGAPDKDDISMFRIWFEEMEKDIEILLYSWDFVGNKWKSPTVFTTDTASEVDTLIEQVFIDVIGTESEHYEPPFRLGNDYDGSTEDDHSLQVRYEEIAPQHGVKISRWDYDADDYRGYQRLKIYVHNDGNDPTFYLRMGRDATSYYEVHGVISEGDLPSGAGDDQWREFTFDLKALACLKVESYEFLRYYDSLDAGVESSAYPGIKILGVPSFASIKYFELGFINESETEAITGEVWFNDIRLQGPYKETGTKLSADAKLVLADVGSVTSKYSWDDGNFINFTAPQTPRTSGKTHDASVSGNLNFEKFGPDRLGFKLPASWGYYLTRVQPRYSPEITDYALAEDDTVWSRERSDIKTLSFSASHPQSKSKILKYSLDALTASAHFRESVDTASAGLRYDSSFTQNYSVSYSIKPDLYFTIFKKEKIRYFPSSIQLSSNFDESYSRSIYQYTLYDSVSHVSKSQNASLSWRASTSFPIIKYVPFNASYNETRALSRDVINRTQVTFDTLLNSDFALRTLSLSSGITSINLKSFGRPSVSVSSSFTQDRSENVYKQLLSYGNSADSIGTPQVADMNNNSSITFAWRGFNPNGLITKTKSKTEKDLRDLRKELKEAERDSVSQAPEPPSDSESADTMPGDTLPADTLPVDNLPADTLPTDSLPSDSIPAEPEVILTAEEEFYERRLTQLKTLGAITGAFMPVGAEVTFGKSASQPKYLGDFDWAENWEYIIGLEDSIGLHNDADDIRFDPVVSTVWNESYKLNGGLKLFQATASGNVSYKYTETSQAMGGPSYSSSWTLPSVSVTYGNIGKLLEKWATSSQLRSGFTRTLTESGHIEEIDTVFEVDTVFDDTTITVYDPPMQKREPDNITTSYNLTPLLSWNTSWKNKINTDLSINYGVAITENLYGAPIDTIFDTTITKGGVASVSYTFNKPSGFKLPFLKHVKFKNDLTLGTAFNYTESLNKNSNRHEDPNNKSSPLKEIKTTTVSGSVNAKYTFSDAFDGGANFTVSNFTNSDKTDINHTDYDFDVFVVFRF